MALSSFRGIYRDSLPGSVYHAAKSVAVSEDGVRGQPLGDSTVVRLV